MTNRLVNIDIIKFLAIIIMVIDHMILVSLDGDLNMAQAIFFTFVPLCQMGFLFASGYLMAFSFNKNKFNKYVFRITLFVILFMLMTWLSGEQLISSGSILLNFALSTAIGLFFLYRDKIKELITLMALLFGIDIVWQIFTMNGVTVLNDMLANYPYPVNSFSLYFFLGIILFHYKERFIWIKSVWSKLLVLCLVLFYPFLYAFGIHVNDYNYYQHLPLLLLSSAFIGLYFFFAWEKVNLPAIIYKPIIKIADALLYIYVIHYIVLFGLLKGIGLNWWQLSLVVVFIIFVCIGLDRAVHYFRESSKKVAKV